MPICIAGMHRSGTSMITRLLNLSGVSLGPESELLPPNEFNTEGYWENDAFIQLNEAVLSQFGGGWDVPPTLPAGWQERAELDPLRRRAQELADRFMRYEPWAWKDPRSSLTIPFWRTVVPDLKVLICVRNPLEVVISLTRRSNCSDAFGLGLWLQYNERALADAAGVDYCVTHYDAYYEDAPRELQRVLKALGLEASEAQIQVACESIDSGVRHHRVGMQDMLDAGLSEQVLECYTRLVELGKVEGSLRNYQENGAAGNSNGTDTAAWQSSYAAMRLNRLEAEVLHLREYVQSKTQEANMLTEMLKAQVDLNEGLNERVQALEDRRNEYLKLGQREGELEKQVGWYKSQLEAIKGTMFYKLGAAYWSLHSKLRGGGG